MIDLKQKELDDWQARNFGRHYDDLLKCALGMAEEVGEVCHHVLKGTQKIRSGLNDINKAEIADGVADTLIYGLQILSLLGLDAEEEISAVIDKVLQRDWKANPSGTGCGKPVQEVTSNECQCEGFTEEYVGSDGFYYCRTCGKNAGGMA